jgi:hypothetical protein
MRQAINLPHSLSNPTENQFFADLSLVDLVLSVAATVVVVLGVVALLTEAVVVGFAVVVAAFVVEAVDEVVLPASVDLPSVLYVSAAYAPEAIKAVRHMAISSLFFMIITLDIVNNKFDYQASKTTKTFIVKSITIYKTTGLCFASE